MYADLLRDGTWSVPSRTVPRVLSGVIIGIAGLFLGITTTLVLGSEMVLAGQLEPMPGQGPPDLSDLSRRGRSWYEWRMGRAGQRWGARELSRHLQWVEGAEARMTRIARSAGISKAGRARNRSSNGRTRGPGGSTGHPANRRGAGTPRR